jgi:hypothetical protein
MSDFEKNVKDTFGKFGGSFGEQIVNAVLSNVNPANIGAISDMFEQQAVTINKAFTNSREKVMEIKKAIGDSVTDVKLLGGDIQDAFNIQQNVSNVLNFSISS